MDRSGYPWGQPSLARVLTYLLTDLPIIVHLPNGRVAVATFHVPVLPILGNMGAKSDILVTIWSNMGTGSRAGRQ
jgi:hypothetical protein